MSAMTNVRRARLARFRRNASKIIFEMLERRTLYAVQVDAFTDLLGPEPEVPDYYTSPRQVDAEDGLTGSAYRVIADHRENTGEIVLASFTDVSAGAIGDYSATIDFGDSATAAGTIVDRGNGRFDVIGSHSYLFGQYNINVSVTDLRDSSRGTEQQSYAQIIAPAVAGVGKSITASSGEVFQGVVATFTGIDETLLDRYSANIRWGDGYEPGTLRSLGGGVVEVIGTHTFAKPGKFDMTITLNAHGPTAQSRSSWGGAIIDSMWSWSYGGRGGATAQDVRGRADVGIGALVGQYVQPKIISGIHSRARIASFDINDPGLSLDALEAVVTVSTTNWNNLAAPQTTTETIGNKLRIVGDQVFVDLNHLFVAQQHRDVEVRVFDRSRDTGMQQIASVKGYLSPETHLSSKIAELGHLPVNEAFTRKLGTLSALGAAEWNSEFSVLVNWGDGTDNSAGWLVPTGEGTWDVYGAHTYEGTGYYRDVRVDFTVIETRTPKNASQPTPPDKYSISPSGGVHADYTLPPGPIDGFTLHRYTEEYYATGFQEDERNQIHFAVVTVADSLDGLEGVIRWSDGSTSQPTFEAYATDRATVDTNHRFNTPGFYTGVLSVTRGGVTHETSLTISVYEKTTYTPPVQLQPIAVIEPAHVSATKGVAWSGIVGTITPTDGDATPQDFTVEVYFPDGWAKSAQIEVGDDGVWRIRAEHLFTQEHLPARGDERQFDIYVTKDERRLEERGTVRVEIDRTLPDLNRKYSGQIRQLEAFTATLMEITSPDPGADASAFTATIDWGDGTVTTGQVVHKYRSTFELVGQHTYRTDGSHEVLVTVTGPGGTVQSHVGLWAQYHPVEVSETPVAPLGFTVSGAVAKFVDFQGEDYDHDQKVIDHATLIDWGDGTISAGEIVANANGGWDVVGTHTYAAVGDYTVSVLVRRNEHSLWMPMWWDYVVGDVVLNQRYSGSDAAQGTERLNDFSLVRTITITGKGAEAPTPTPRLLSAPIATPRFSSTPLSRDAFDLVASESEVLETPSAIFS